MSEAPSHKDNDSPWITVGDLGKGFAPDSYALDHRADLNGCSYTLHFDDGHATEYEFDSEWLRWQGKTDGQAAYRATSLREGIYLVDFLAQEAGGSYSVSIVLDTARAAFTQVIGRMPTSEAVRVGLYEKARNDRPLTDVVTEFSRGSIDKPPVAGECSHLRTKALVGKRNLYRYSPTEVYEHVYLNERFYTWHCVQGVEQGLCDTDRCHYFEIAEQLYLFVWQEKIIPTLGLVMIDMLAHRSDGKIVGYAADDTAELANFPVTSYCSLLNQTDYSDA